MKRGISVQLPGRSLIRWLIDPGGNLPPDIRLSLVAGLYGSLPIFIGGVLNTVAARIPTTPFLLWALFEVVLAILRLPALLRGRKAIAEGRQGPTDIYIALAILWAASVGYGSFISVASVIDCLNFTPASAQLPAACSTFTESCVGCRCRGRMSAGKSRHPKQKGRPRKEQPRPH